MTFNIAVNTSFWDTQKLSYSYDYSTEVHETQTWHWVIPFSNFDEDYVDEYDDYTATGYCYGCGDFYLYEGEQLTSASTRFNTTTYYNFDYHDYLTTLTTNTTYFPMFSWCNVLCADVCFESVSSSNGLLFTRPGNGPDIWEDELCCGYIAEASEYKVSCCANVSTICYNPRKIGGNVCSDCRYSYTFDGNNLSVDLSLTYDMTTGYGQVTYSYGSLTSNTNGRTASVKTYKNSPRFSIGSGNMAYIPAGVNLFYKGSLRIDTDARNVYIGDRFVTNSNVYYTFCSSQYYLSSFEVTDYEHAIPYGHWETYTTKYDSDIIMCCCRGNVYEYSTTTTTNRVTCNTMAVLTGSKTVSFPIAFHNCYDDLTKRYTYTEWDYNAGAARAIFGAGCMSFMLSNGQTELRPPTPMICGKNASVTAWPLSGSDITLNDGRIIHPFETFTITGSLASNEQWREDIHGAAYSIEYTTTTFPEGIDTVASVWKNANAFPLASCYGTTTTIPWDITKKLYQTCTAIETITSRKYFNSSHYDNYSEYTGHEDAVFVLDGLAPIRGCPSIGHGVTMDKFICAYTTYGTTYSCFYQNNNIICRCSMNYEPLICGNATAWKYTESRRLDNQSADVMGTIYKYDDYRQSNFGYETFTGTKYRIFCNYPTDCMIVSTYYF